VPGVSPLLVTSGAPGRYPLWSYAGGASVDRPPSPLTSNAYC